MKDTEKLILVAVVAYFVLSPKKAEAKPPPSLTDTIGGFVKPVAGFVGSAIDAGMDFLASLGTSAGATREGADSRPADQREEPTPQMLE